MTLREKERRELERKLNFLEAQLMDVQSKSERMVRAEYNVDYKEEAISLLTGDIEACAKAIELAKCEETRGFVGVYVDPAFSSCADFDQMRIL